MASNGPKLGVNNQLLAALPPDVPFDASPAAWFHGLR